MAVMKKKDMNWKDYLRELALSDTKISDIEKVELAGFLLRRDMDDPELAAEVTGMIFCHSHLPTGDMIASFMIAESPETTEDLLNFIKKNVISYYSQEVDELLKEAIEEVERERYEAKLRENPKDEYDPNNDAA